MRYVIESWTNGEQDMHGTHDDKNKAIEKAKLLRARFGASTEITVTDANDWTVVYSTNDE